MKLSQMTVSLIIFCGIFVGITTFYTEFAESYDVEGIDILTNYTSSFNSSMYDVQDFSTTIKGNMTGSTGLLEKIYFSLGMIWGATMNILKLPEMIAGISTSVINMIGVQVTIPPWFVALLGAVILTYIVFKVLQFFIARDA